MPRRGDYQEAIREIQSHYPQWHPWTPLEGTVSWADDVSEVHGFYQQLPPFRPSAITEDEWECLVLWKLGSNGYGDIASKVGAHKQTVYNRILRAADKLAGVKHQRPGHRPNAGAAKWRKAVLTRDEYTCQRCGRTKDIEVHHVVPYAIDPSLATHTANGLTFCRSCHDHVHSGDGWLVLIQQRAPEYVLLRIGRVFDEEKVQIAHNLTGVVLRLGWRRDDESETIVLCDRRAYEVVNATEGIPDDVSLF